MAIAVLFVGLGAVLHFAFEAKTTGLVLMLVGGMGLVIALFFEVVWPEQGRNGDGLAQ